MPNDTTFSTAHDKLLFTPGPLTTSRGVKQAMLRDLGSRDAEFISLVKETRDELLRVGRVSQALGYEAVLMQGSGTFGIESVISSVIPKDGKLLVLVNGAYGERITAMAAVHGIATRALRFDEDEAVSVEAAASAIAQERFTHLAVVHCETTTGILNPVMALGQLCTENGVSYFVDSMSAFGAVPLDVGAAGIDYLVSSANKCIEGVPGFSFVLARREALLRAEGQARTMSLDLFAQWKGLEQNGQFRFTPPTHALLAFRQALRELGAEGGVEGRAARYARNHQVLAAGMAQLGFKEYLRPDQQGPIITAYHYPAHPKFRFQALYEKLSDRGFVIYPGKLTKVDCFRIGTIGRMFPGDVEALLGAMEAVLVELGVLGPPRRLE